MTGISSYSTTPSENVNANTGINWDEGMPPAAVNNSARQNMTDSRLRWNDAAWFQYGIGSKTVAAVYASGTSFTLAGADATAYWHVERRVKAVGASTGTIYGSVFSSSYATSTTTVTVTWDSGSLSNESLTIYAGTAQVTGKPVPFSGVSGSASGSWTPSDASGSGLSFTNVSAGYQKVGNVVTAWGSLTFPSCAADTNNITIGGLPFTCQNSDGARTPGVWGGYATPSFTFMTKNTTQFTVRTPDLGTAIKNQVMSLAAAFFVVTYPVA